MKIKTLYKKVSQKSLFSLFFFVFIFQEIQYVKPASVKLMYPSPAVRDKGAPFQKINDSAPAVWI